MTPGVTLFRMSLFQPDFDRVRWRPGQPCGWVPNIARLEIDPAIERLVVVSDLHAFREPLDAMDECLARLNGRYCVFVNGDLLEGGLDAKATIGWVQKHAAGRTTRGNHDSRIFAYQADRVADEPAIQWAPDAELGGYRTMDEDALRFIADLPDQLLVQWRGKSIRIVHGHQSPSTTAYTDWRSTPDEITRLFHDPTVDLTVVGHTHHAFVQQGPESVVANSGSVAVPILRYRNGDGAVIDRDGIPVDTVIRGGESSFLVITESSGRLNPQLVRLNYDRVAMLGRYEGIEHLNTPFELRKKWVLEHFFDSKLASGKSN